jgi:hypothetical protein
MANAKESPRPLCTLLQALKSIERLCRRWEVGDKNVVIVISHCLTTTTTTTKEVQTSHDTSLRLELVRQLMNGRCRGSCRLSSWSSPRAWLPRSH